VPEELDPALRRSPLALLSSPAAQADLGAMVRAYQVHTCGAVCLKHGHTTCRFRYPRKLQEHAGVAVRGTEGNRRTYVALQRNHPWVNTYSAQLLIAWRGSIDIQLIADPRGTAQYVTRVAHYASAATKPETDALNQRVKFAIQRMPANCVMSSKLSRVVNAVIGARQVPIQQALAVLLGSNECPIVDCSRSFEQLNIAPRGEAAVCVNPRAVRNAPADESVSIYSQKALLRAYYHRPATGASPLGDPWAELSLFEFISWFSVEKKGATAAFAVARRIQMTNGITVTRRKKQAAVVTTPFVTADRGDDRCAWALLKLYLPHRSDDELLFGFTDHAAPAVAALESKWAQLRGCGHANWDSRRALEQAREADYESEGEAPGAAAQGGDAEIDGLVRATYAEDDAADLCAADAAADAGAVLQVPGTSAAIHKHHVYVARSDLYGQLVGFADAQNRLAVQRRQKELSVFDRKDAAAVAREGEPAVDDVISQHEMKLAQMVDRLSPQQRDAYNCVVYHHTPGRTAGGQLLAIVAGEGGSGKSYWLNVVALFMRLQYGSRAASVTAWTNRAACLVNGVSFCRLFALNTGNWRAEMTGHHAELRRGRVKEKFEPVKVIIIDEKSLLALEQLLGADVLLRWAFPERGDVPFAGISVILLGDYFQLPPVSGSRMYCDPKGTVLSGDAWKGRNLMVQHFNTFFEFTTPNFRQLGDPTYHAICQCARFSLAPTAEQLAALNARFRSSAAEAHAEAGNAALWTATTHRDVNAINAEDIRQRSLDVNNSVVNIFARHHVRLTTGNKRPRRVSAKPAAEVADGDEAAWGAEGAEDASGLTYAERAALMAYDPFIKPETGKRQAGPKGALPHMLRLALGTPEAARLSAQPAVSRNARAHHANCRC
jgi:hypothetical protein